MARKDGREELPPMHPRRLLEFTDDVPLKDREYVIAAEAAKNITWATTVLRQRINEHNLAVDTKAALTALRKTSREYLEAQGRTADETRTIAITRGVPTTETIPGPLARVTAALDSVEKEVLSWGVYDFEGKRIEMEWRERWALDVERYLTSREMAEVLRVVVGVDRRIRGRTEEKEIRDETKNAGKRRKRVLAKMGWTDERADHLKKVGAAKR